MLSADDGDDERDEWVCQPEAELGVSGEADEYGEGEVSAGDVLGGLAGRRT